jgi:iron complex transport system permease protein
MTRKSSFWGRMFGSTGAVSASLALAALLLALASIGIGPVPIAPFDAAHALFGNDGAISIIVREIRLPRALLALLIGGTLGLCGGALQGLMRNPLAAPSVFGAPQAAGLGAVVALYFRFVDAYSYALPIAAIAGAFLSVGLVVLVAGPRASTMVLVLAGLAVGALAGAATSLAISLSPNPFAVTEIVFWLLGSLEDRTMRHVALATPFLIVGAVLILSTGSALRALALGDETAQTMGVPVARIRLLIVIGVALCVGAGVAVAGTIGFIGLVAPHLVRPLVGHDPKRVLVPSMLAGAVLLTAADIAVRLIPSGSEVKVGVLTALVGVPFFLWIVLHRRAELGGVPA